MGNGRLVRIGLLAVDLDGTLLDDAKRMNERDAAALRVAAGRGVKVVIASARPPRSVRPFHALLGLDTLQINYNGALIWDEPRQRVFHHQPMAPGLVRRIIMSARDAFADVLVSCEVLDRWFTDRFDQTYTTETGRLFRPDVIAPFDSFLDRPITKLMLLGNGAMMGSLHELLSAKFARHVNIVRADPELLQIMDRRVSKADALRRVADHYGVAMLDVMAIGDAANDLPMLQAAGLAVAVGNAHPLVRQAAHWVAPSNNECGVATALAHFGLVD